MHPKIRWPLIFDHRRDEGKIYIRCPIGISNKIIYIRDDLYPFISSLTGENSIDSLCAYFKLTRSVADQVIKELDGALFLDNIAFKDTYSKIKTTYAKIPVREAALAGSAFPSDRPNLEKKILSLIPQDIYPVKNPLGLIVPHIDYTRGGREYGMGYAHLPQNAFDTVFLIGTSHQYGLETFVLTEKDFQSPFGILPNAKESTRRIALAYGLQRSYGEELRHRTEHSLELQLPFLQAGSVSKKIIPILVGGFYDFITNKLHPEDDDKYNELVEAIATEIDTLKRNGEKVGFIVSVDMAHVGPQFGDPDYLDAAQLQRVKERDELYLETIITKNKKQLFKHFLQDGDARRVCGYPSVYLLLDLLEKCYPQASISLIKYSQAVDDRGICGVTLSSLLIQ